MSFFSTLIAILLITKIILIFIREHDQVMRLTNARANIIGEIKKKIICLLDPDDSKIIKKFRLMGTWSDNDGMFDRKNVEN